MSGARYFVGLGANLDDRLGHLRRATRELDALVDTRVARRSGIWETRPLGPGKGAYLNAVVEVHTRLSAIELLERLLDIERAHGRVRRERWGDRVLDLDVLCGFDHDGAITIDGPALSLPHLGLATRDFVLQPLVEIEPGLCVGGYALAERLAELTDDQRTLLRRLDDPL